MIIYKTIIILVKTNMGKIYKFDIVGIFVLFIVCNCAYETDKHYTYDNFMINFGRNYTGPERDNHQAIFNKNYAQLKRKNKYEVIDLEVNQFLDWNETQIDTYFNFKPEKLKIPVSSVSLKSSSLFASPSIFDWRAYDRVTSVKYQGYCGCCWAFTSTAQYQSLIAIATNGTKHDLSQQYVRQCDPHSNGCFGGFPYTALSLINSTGIPLESQYPYIGKSSYQASICGQKNTKKIRYKPDNIFHFQTSTTQEIQQYVVNYGPLSVGINGNSNSFMYAGKSGLIACPSNSELNHAVLLVGYNISHWFIKNSWGISWGNNGFGYISKENDCGMHSWVDVMQIKFPWKLTPDESLTQKVSLNIQITDSYGDGWNNNILGLKQNGRIVATFGKEFKTGKTFWPVSVNISAHIQTQIIFVQYSSYTEEIGFTIKTLEGAIVYKHQTGQSLSYQTILNNFCPRNSCNTSLQVIYYLTVNDLRGDGWNGNVLAFRQNDRIQTFGFVNGSLPGPTQYNFIKGVNVDVIVQILGTGTEQVSYILRTYTGAVVNSITPGTQFAADSKISSFCPNCINYDPVQIILDISGRKQFPSYDNQLKSYKVATFVLTGLLFIMIIVSTIAIIMKAKKQPQVIIDSQHKPPSQSPKDIYITSDNALAQKVHQAQSQKNIEIQI